MKNTNGDQTKIKILHITVNSPEKKADISTMSQTELKFAKSASLLQITKYQDLNMNQTFIIKYP